MNTTTVFNKILENRNKRIQVLQGGTSSSKTFSILQFLFIIATQSPKPLLISVVAETMPNLKRGAIRDFIGILGEDYSENMHNKSDHSFTIGQSIIEFFSADQPDKVRGPRRDILFINECNNVRKDAFEQLEVRTKKMIFLDFNPTQPFWAHDLISRKDVSYDISTYKDNQYLDKEIVKAIEARRDDANWWRVYGEGQVGKVEGLIIPRFELVDALPPGLDTVCGLDFGYSNDPSVLIEVGIRGGELWMRELFYSRGMTNPDIVSKLKELKVPLNYLIYADSAEPKSIKEIFDQGYKSIKPCVKGEGSFNIGIDFIRRYKLNITKESVNVIRDFRNATWDSDINGNYLNKPCKGYLHGIDALRYALTDLISPARSVSGGNAIF